NIYGLFANFGAFLKSGGTDVSTIASKFDNHAGGVIEARSGTLRILALGTCTGGMFNATAGAHLAFVGSGDLMTGSYTGSGDGEVRFERGRFRLDTSGVTFNFDVGLTRWAGGLIEARGNLTNSGDFTLVGGDSL